MSHTASHSEPGFEVVWPSGRSAAVSVSANTSVSDLSGKTVAFVWDYLFRGDEMFTAVSELIRSRYQNVTFLGPEVFGNIHGADAEERDSLEKLPARLREYGVDVAVVAVGA
jgi:hypothetical protein